LRDWKLIKK